jgi:hypothetical protein
VLKDLIKVIQQEQYCYKDPITEFLECLYVNYDFEGAQRKLCECEEVSFYVFSKRNEKSILFKLNLAQKPHI